MFPNINPGTQTESSTISDFSVNNDFATPTVPMAERPDPVKSLSTTLLVLSILLAIISFAYTTYLSSIVKVSKGELEKYDNQKTLIYFSQKFNEVKGLSDRTKMLSGIYNDHTYLAGMLLPIIESATESRNGSYVYFNRFSMKAGKTSSSIALSGVALDYATLIRQMRNFKDPKYAAYISNFKLNSLALDQSGNVNFDLSFDINVGGDKYKDYKNISLNSLNTSLDTVDKKNSTDTGKSGPLFKVTTSATPTIPLDVKNIYDKLKDATTSEVSITPASTSTSSATGTSTKK